MEEMLTFESCNEICEDANPFLGKHARKVGAPAPQPETQHVKRSHRSFDEIKQDATSSLDKFSDASVKADDMISAYWISVGKSRPVQCDMVSDDELLGEFSKQCELARLKDELGIED